MVYDAAQPNTTPNTHNVKNPEPRYRSVQVQDWQGLRPGYLRCGQRGRPRKHSLPLFNTHPFHVPHLPTHTFPHLPQIETGKYYAVKVINKKLMEGREHMIRNEINVLRRISQEHKNILSLVDYFETMNNLYLVTDLALGGELFDRICKKGSYFERDAADLVRTITDAVGHLHDHGIVHRDLKPENLLFRTPDEDADLLVADFGLSRIIDSDKFHVLTTTCGTPGYMAPEIFKKIGHGKPVDMWAIGVITFFLLCGYTPFESESSIDEMHAIMNADYQFDEQYWSGVSDEGRHLTILFLSGGCVRDRWMLCEFVNVKRGCRGLETGILKCFLLTHFSLPLHSQGLHQAPSNH
ncbi:kinase-like domain-containing protein [Jimgerdemannia flammicorona]|uniref:Kinase-like domain-containing protein n=1 Tax=Jimgerdemannia flammicorona TaxID=994334 RepID=A0A433DGK3_9FUNG|nr:kinase-like domain-containing protein [Jimgerdemannia flammicorona]